MLALPMYPFASLIATIFLLSCLHDEVRSQCTGRVADPQQCDAYTDCINGTPEPAVCPDGLVFSPEAKGYPCLYPQEVDCTGRPAIQTPQPTADCPRQFGLFRLGDAYNCGQYMNCVNGQGYVFNCPEGLAFNEETLQCDWPDLVPTCNAEETSQPTADCPRKFGLFRLGDANNCGQYMNCFHGQGIVFNCPEGLAFNEETSQCDWPDLVPTCNAEGFLGFSCPVTYHPVLGFPGGNSYHRSPSDCQAFFVCEKDRPRLFRCPEGKAFNEEISACDGIENVTGCYVPDSARSYTGDYNQIRLAN